MTTLTFRRPTVLPIHAQSWTRPAGNLDFRVTQRFDVADSYYGGTQKHNAVDLGNFRCGDAVVAMLAGRVRRVKDNAIALGAATDALGLVIDHGNGITSEYWHLQSYSVGVVDGVMVTAGQQVASVGRTGLGNVCHLHTEVKRDGVRIDPEPLMFGGSLNIEEDDVKIPTGLKPIAQGVVGSGNRLRIDSMTQEGSRIIGGAAPSGIGEAKTYFVQVYGFGVPGEPYTLGGKAGSSYAWVGVFGATWFVAEPLVTQLTASDVLSPRTIEVPTGITPEQAAQAQRLEFIRGRDEGTAAYAAAGALAAQGVAP